MSRSLRQFLGILCAVSLIVVSCRKGGPEVMPVVPVGFDVSMLEILACPEDRSKLRLATRAEFEEIRAKVTMGSVRYRDGRAAPSKFDGLLIRADGRVAYTIKDGIADMIPDNGIALDATIGRAEPDRYR